MALVTNPAALRAQALSLAAVSAALAIMPLFGLSNQFLQVFTLAFLFAVPAVGLGLLYGEAGQLSVASGALLGVGAYVAAIGGREGVLTIWSALPAAALAAAIAATLIGLTALRVRGHYFLIVTFAFAELWRISTVNLRTLTGGNQGIMVLEPVVFPGIGEIDSVRAYYWFALATVYVASLIVVLLRWSPFGRSLRVVRENERLAISLGLNAARAHLVAFAISGALAGAAGTLYAYNLKHIGPDLFGANAGIQIVLILLIGGARSAVGPLLGAIVFFAIPELISVDPITTQILYGAALIVIVLASPDGVVPGVAAWLRRRAVGRRSSVTTVEEPGPMPGDAGRSASLPVASAEPRS